MHNMIIITGILFMLRKLFPNSDWVLPWSSNERHREGEMVRKANEDVLEMMASLKIRSPSIDKHK